MPDWLLPSVTLVAAFIASAFTWGLWLSRQFYLLREGMYGKMERMQIAILDKLEYHERHDDTRFDNVNRDIFAIKLRNAAIDGRKTNATSEKTNGS